MLIGIGKKSNPKLYSPLVWINEHLIYRTQLAGFPPAVLQNEELVPPVQQIGAGKQTRLVNFWWQQTVFSALRLHSQTSCTVSIMASSNWAVAAKDPCALAVIWFLRILNHKEGKALANWSEISAIFHVVTTDQALETSFISSFVWVAQH